MIVGATVILYPLPIIFICKVYAIKDWISDEDSFWSILIMSRRAVLFQNQDEITDRVVAWEFKFKFFF